MPTKHVELSPAPASDGGPEEEWPASKLKALLTLPLRSETARDLLARAIAAEEHATPFHRSTQRHFPRLGKKKTHLLVRCVARGWRSFVSSCGNARAKR